MFTVATDWNPKQSRLKELLKTKEHFIDGINLCNEMHSIIHSSKVSNSTKETFEDEVLRDLEDDFYRIMPTIKDVTIAWNIWHITRIEDLTMNLLVAKENQILNSSWLKKLHISITDTGNAMCDDEIICFSQSINILELKNYRDAVGIQSKKILQILTKEDLKRKIDRKDIERIHLEGGVINHPDSIWLLDFWSKKDVAGILLMPLTRHQVGHLNDCRKLKKKNTVPC